MKNKKLFRISRIIFDILAFFYLLFSEVKEEYSFIFCPLNRVFSLDCYLCGMTRAFILSFHFKFSEAIKYNPLVIIFYPSLILLAIQDTFITLKCLIKKEENSSFLEFLINKI